MSDGIWISNNSSTQRNASTSTLVSANTQSKKFVLCYKRKYDPEQHCGVKLPSMDRPCTRSLTCSIHPISLKRAVKGRSKSYDDLLRKKHTQTKTTINRRISKSETSVFDELLSKKRKYRSEYSILAKPESQSNPVASTSMFSLCQCNNNDEKQIIQKIEQDLINSYNPCSTLNSCANLKDKDQLLTPKPCEDSTSDEGEFDWFTKDLNLDFDLDSDLVPDFIVDILDDLENFQPNSNIDLDIEETVGQKLSLDTEKPIDQKLSLDTEKPMDQKLSLDTEKPIDQKLSLDTEKPMDQKLSLDTEKPMDQKLSLDTEKPIDQKLSLDTEKPMVPNYTIDIEETDGQNFTIDIEETDGQNFTIDIEEIIGQKLSLGTEKPIKENNAEMKTNTGMMTNAPTINNTSPRTPTIMPNQQRFVPLRYRIYDPDHHCGVRSSSSVGPCTRSLTCRFHRIALRRLVMGRSRPFDELLQMKLNNKQW